MPAGYEKRKGVRGEDEVVEDFIARQHPSHDFSKSVLR